MRIPDSLAESLLKKSTKVTEEQLKALHEQSLKEKRPLQDLIIKNNLLSEKDLTKLYAEEIEVPFVELKAADIKNDDLKKMPERIARQYKAVVFGVAPEGTLLIAMEDPDDMQAMNFLRKELGNEIKVHITASGALHAALDQYRGNISSELTKVISSDEDADVSDEVDESDLAEDSPVAQTVNIIIEYGINSGASDIHIEPREEFVVVRYRIDGILREANK